MRVNNGGNKRAAEKNTGKQGWDNEGDAGQIWRGSRLRRSTGTQEGNKTLENMADWLLCNTIF